ncbi:MAG: hypothetical protein CMC82_04025 [Flavobacteriaceae bacterium]|nr:hypothetical protein [Flavobacteriaceae bacterium]
MTEFLIHVSLNMRLSSLHTLCYLAVLIMPCISTAQYTEVINSNRPSQSMGAFGVGKRVYQLEQGLSFRTGGFSTFQDASYTGVGARTQIRIGLFKEQLEMVGTADYQIDALRYSNAVGTYKLTRNSLRNLGAGAKYLVYDPFRNVDKYKPNLYSWHANNKIRWRDLIPAVSVYAGAQFSTGGVYPYQENFLPLFDYNYRPITEPFISGAAMLILQQHLRPGLVVVHNIGMRYITADVQQKKLLGTVTYSTQSKWSFFCEYTFDDSPLYRDLTLGVGVAYLFSNNFQLDVAVQQTLKNTPSLMTAGIGVSYRLDRHNIWKEEPQNIEVNKQKRAARKKDKSENKKIRKAAKRTGRGLKKLDRKQKKIERKLKRMK